MPNEEMVKKVRLSLERLLPRLEANLAQLPERDVFLKRLHQHFPTAFEHLYNLYGNQYDFFYHLERILGHLINLAAARPADLRALDQQREQKPNWFQSEAMLGGVCYVDLFAGNLQGLREKIPYFCELGLTYLHLMPLFKAPEGNSDGGYAVSSYRDVNPALGTMAELAALAAEFRANGISLVLDFVFNHTSDEHDWAKQALAGEPTYQDYYFMFPDRTIPDQYEQHLREIFPEHRRGNFNFRSEVNQWVWTTFHNFQWDLNYSNPGVFNAMLGEMLTLANNGVEILRLDAVAFIWKQMGTSCESLPQVHWIIQAYNALGRIAAPAMIFKSEAIVHPAAVATYISPEEAPVSYNPTLMALTWEALATREVKLLRKSMEHWFALPDGCAWVNYVRSHDDIGWTFADEDGYELGINGFDHRLFLNAFYNGRFPGSFAKGLPFNLNPVTQDMRISGTTASLAGLEQALSINDSVYIDNAIQRIVMIYSIAMSAGGIPLIYLGDEIATLNDYTYQNNHNKAEDSRWVHRTPFNWQRAEKRHDPATNEGRVFSGLKQVIAARKAAPELAGGQAVFFDCGNGHILSYTRSRKVLVLANFSEHPQSVSANALRAQLPQLVTSAVDVVTGQTVSIAETLTLNPYQFLWLMVNHSGKEAADSRTL
ncbi:MAG: cyclomaltodextrinase C-terminal domain-containing protein [Chloroflexi bacterium]|nr:cyclomaltodextrinase C-terminal domain-containing protein [Chloroflexota bacterium]MCC6891425.1 amylosucrase [Anaerolineae bacterium]